MTFWNYFFFNFIELQNVKNAMQFIYNFRKWYDSELEMRNFDSHGRFIIPQPLQARAHPSY